MPASLENDAKKRKEAFLRPQLPPAARCVRDGGETEAATGDGLDFCVPSNLLLRHFREPNSALKLLRLGRGSVTLRKLTTPIG
jgi:hypothetical protein